MIKDIVLWLHIVCGGALLLLGLLQIIFKKGGKRHRDLGKFYVILMLFVCGSALFISSKEIMRQNSIGHLFLFVIALFSQYAVVSGYLLGKFKSNRSFFLGKIVVVYAWVNVAAFACLTALFWSSFGWICLVFGTLQLLGALEDTKYYWTSSNKLRKGTRYWLYTHSGRMLGSYIAAVTAFLINVIECPYPLVLWLGPTVIGSALIVWFNKTVLNTMKETGMD